MTGISIFSQETVGSGETAVEQQQEQLIEVYVHEDLLPSDSRDYGRQAGFSDGTVGEVTVDHLAFPLNRWLLILLN